jgi:hypothetical protein
MKRTTIITALIGVFCHVAGAALVTFESFSLGPSGYDNGSGGDGGFTSEDGTNFLNNYDTDTDTWSGFAISNITNNTLKGSGNQYSAIPGSGIGGSSNYAIGLYLTSELSTQVTFSSVTNLLGRGTYITNTTWAYYEMSEGGDLNPKKFGGSTGDDPDWFKLVIEGFVGSNPDPVGITDFYLADFRPTDNAQDYIVDDWSFVDLSSLGSVDRVTFKLVASDTGINVPAYFAMDNFMAVPEPSSFLIVVGGLGLVLRRKR